jgi:hypothetical protein
MVRQDEREYRSLSRLSRGFIPATVAEFASEGVCDPVGGELLAVRGFAKIAAEGDGPWFKNSHYQIRAGVAKTIDFVAGH